MGAAGLRLLHFSQKLRQDLFFCPQQEQVQVSSWADAGTGAGGEDFLGSKGLGEWHFWQVLCQTLFFWPQEQYQSPSAVGAGGGVFFGCAGLSAWHF